ncbi:fibronectin type III domain-containing protein [Rubrimonas sp.]|uniref:fibronectin type III domain-containing protein n=1 Tax=Rubrimonas sp. TaxID=2036015 RepID=UPI002FDC85B8
MTQFSIGLSIAARPIQNHQDKLDPDKGGQVDTALDAPVIFSVSLSSGAVSTGDIVAMIVACEGNPAPTLAYRWRLDGALISGAESASYATTVRGVLVGEARAVNSVGETAWIASPALVVTATAPMPMGAPTVTGGIELAMLSFAAAPADGGSPVDLYGYEVASADDAAFAAPVALGMQAERMPDVAISPLAAGSYIARTRARNAAGWGAWSPPSAAASVSTAATAPAAMDAPSVETLSGAALRATRAPAPADGGSAITSYDLRHSVDGSSWIVVADVAASHDLIDLPSGATHFVQTRAVNAVGAGPWSPSASGTTWIAPVLSSVELSPAAPFVGDVVTAAVLVTGAPPPTLEYRWLLDGATIAEATAASCIIAAPGVHCCEVRATNSAGQTPWVASGDVAALGPPPVLDADDATLVDAQTSPSAVYLWADEPPAGYAIEVRAPGDATYRTTPAGWSLLPAAAGVEAEALVRYRGTFATSDPPLSIAATPTAQAANSYAVFRDTVLTRAAQGVTWAAAGLDAAAARTALWAGTALGALTLSGGSVVTPAEDGGLTHDGSAVVVADGAAAAPETFTVARMATVNIGASSASAWTYFGGAFGTTGTSVDLAGRVITRTAGGSTTPMSLTLYSNHGAPGGYLRPGDTLTFSVSGNCTAVGTFGIGIQGTSDVWATGGNANPISTGAWSYTGTITVPAARDSSYFGHAIRIRFDAAFAGTIDLDSFTISGPLALLETVTAKVLGGAAPGAVAPIIIDETSASADGYDVTISLGSASGEPPPTGEVVSILIDDVEIVGETEPEPEPEPEGSPALAEPYSEMTLLKTWQSNVNAYDEYEIGDLSAQGNHWGQIEPYTSKLYTASDGTPVMRTEIDTAYTGGVKGAPYLLVGAHYNITSPGNPFVTGSDPGKLLSTISTLAASTALKEDTAEPNGPLTTGVDAASYFWALQVYASTVRTTDWPGAGGQWFDIQIRMRHVAGSDLAKPTTSGAVITGLSVGGKTWHAHVSTGGAPSSSGRFYVFYPDADYAPGDAVTDLDVKAFIAAAIAHHGTADVYVYGVETWIEPRCGVLDLASVGLDVTLDGASYGVA